MNMNTSLIELTGVIKRFGTHVAVDRLSMKVEKGEIVALLGRTGAGKSTVMSLLMGTTSVDEGQIRVAGVDPAASFQALRGKMSVSFQTDRLLPWRTACENVELGRGLTFTPTLAQRLEEICGVVGGVGGFVHPVCGRSRGRRK